MRRTLEECILYCTRKGLIEPTPQDLDGAFARQDEEYAATALTNLPDQTEHAYYKILRSAALSPCAKGLFPHGTGTDFSHGTQSAMIDLVAARASANIVAPSKVDSDAINEPNTLLLFRWGESLFDGAGTPASLGYIDDDYFPPWDTWLTVTSTSQPNDADCLVSWVPTWARPLVENAMAASPTECLSWGIWEVDRLRATKWQKKEPTKLNRLIREKLLSLLFRRP